MKTSSIISFVILITFLTANSYPQWQQVNGPYGGTVRALHTSGSSIFAGTESYGLWKSDNLGASWFPTNIAAGSVYAISSQNGKVVTATGNYIHISVDNGNNWTTKFVTNNSIRSLAISGNAIIAATISNGVFTSTNNGDNWVYTGFSGQYPEGLTLRENIFYCGALNGVFKSTNSGMNWKPAGLTNMRVVSLTQNANTLFAGTSNNGIFYSTDEGSTWIQSGLNISQTIFSITASGNNIFAATSGSGVYFSPDNGLSWSPTAISGGWIYALTSSGNTVFSSNNNQGVYVTSNNGNTWNQTPFINHSITSFAAIGNVIAVNRRTGGLSNGIFTTSNGGASWVNTGHGFEKICASGNKFFSALNGTGHVYSSTDFGLNWSQTGFSNADGWNSVISSGNNLFASKYAMQRSTNGGETWEILPGIGSSNLVSFAAGNNLVFATGGNNNYLYRSSDNGNSWSHPDFPTVRINSIAISGQMVYCAAQTGLYISSNQGETWVPSSLGEDSVFSVTSQNNYALAGTTTGIYLSANNGNTWQLINTGLPVNTSVVQLFIHNGFIYAGLNGRGIWKRPVAEVLSINIVSSQIPAEYSLFQNYPNPFNPVTKIRFALPHGGFTRLDIFDISGRIVNTLVSENLNAGIYETEFNGTNLASGVYLYKLTSGGFTQTNKMILVK